MTEPGSALRAAVMPVAILMAWPILAIALGSASLPMVGLASAMLGAVVVMLLIRGRLLSTEDAPRRAGRGSARLGLQVVAVASIVLACWTASGAVQSAARDPTVLSECDELVVELVGRANDEHPRVTVLAASGGCSVEDVRIPALILDGDEVFDDAAGPGSTWRLRGDVIRTDPGSASAALVVASDPAELLGAPAWGMWAGQLRSTFASLVADQASPGAPLVLGMSVGDTSLVGEDLDAAMRSASLSHLTAVSGANCAIVVGAVFGLTALLGARRWVRVTAAAAALAGFVVLVTPEPSVVRAAAMAMISLWVLATGQTTRGSSVLGLAIIVTLIADPWLAVTVGFQLSAAASAALILVAPRLAASWSERAPRAPRAILLAVAAAVAAQAACLPLLVALDGELHPWGIPANLLAGPLAGSVTVLGVLACLAASIPLLGPLIATAFVWLAALPASAIAALAHLSAAAPGADLPWPVGDTGIVLAFVFGGALVWALTSGRAGRPVCLALATLMVATLVVRGPGIEVALRVPNWQVAVCDVGQGDALLVRSQSAVALIDTGPDPERLERCLLQFGVTRIQLLVLTHFDLDHVGGAEAMLGRADVVLHGPPDEDADHQLIESFAATGSAVHQVARGTEGGLGAATWRVLWPPGADVEPGNDASVVVAFDGDGLSLLALGDLGADAQRALLRAGLGHFEIVKFSHHGSADQFPPLYVAVAPRLVIIGVGTNDYGHPTEAALTIVASLGAVLVRTDLSGASAVAVTEDGLVVWCERAPP